MRWLLGALAILVIFVAGFFWANNYIYTQKQGTTDYKNATYVLDGVPVTLTDGYAEMPAAPGSASNITTGFFGNEAKGDLNDDTIPDLVFLLTQNSGGSGTFYFVVAALQTTGGGYNGTNGVFLGDRIAPQTTEIRGGEIIVNYARRAEDEPMTAKPSVGVSKYLRVEGERLVEIVR